MFIVQFVLVICAGHLFEAMQRNKNPQNETETTHTGRKQQIYNSFLRWDRPSLKKTYSNLTYYLYPATDLKGLYSWLHLSVLNINILHITFSILWKHWKHTQVTLPFLWNRFDKSEEKYKICLWTSSKETLFFFPKGCVLL